MTSNECKNCGHDEERCTFEEVERRAKELIGFKKQASAALLQRGLKISYEKAAEVLDKLEVEGLVGLLTVLGPETSSFKMCVAVLGEPSFAYHALRD